jgi:hypothetical protein
MVKKPRFTMGLGRNIMRGKAGKAVAVGDGRTEVTHAQVVAKEEAGWKAKGSEQWERFQAGAYTRPLFGSTSALSVG